MKKIYLKSSGIIGSIAEIKEDSMDGPSLYIVKKNFIRKFFLILIKPFYIRVNYMLKDLKGKCDLSIRDTGYHKHKIYENNMEFGYIKVHKKTSLSNNFHIILNEDDYYFKGESFDHRSTAYKNGVVVGNLEGFNPSFFGTTASANWVASFDHDIDIRLIAIGLLYNQLIWNSRM